MVLIQKIDQNRFKSGSGLINNHPIYLLHNGGSFINDLCSEKRIFETIKTIGNVVSENKDSIQNITSSIGTIANTGKAIAETIKTSKELEKLKCIQEIRKRKPREKELSEEQNRALQNLVMGSGFVKV